MRRTILVASICVSLSATSVMAGAQYQHKTAPPPRPAPQPRAKPATRPAGVKSYENKEYRFTFKAPVNWTEGQGSANLYSFNVVTDPPTTATLQIRAAAPDAPLADVDAAVDVLKNSYGAGGKEVKFREVQKTRLGGEDARVLTVEGAQGTGSIERTTVALRDGKMFSCVLSAPDAKSYQKALPPSQTVVLSFRWLDQKAPATTQSAAK
jgi:hypothetical protein